MGGVQIKIDRNWQLLEAEHWANRSSLYSFFFFPFWGMFQIFHNIEGLKQRFQKNTATT